MSSLKSLIPDVDVLLSLAPEELGRILLRLAPSQSKNGVFHPLNFATTVVGTGLAATDAFSYTASREQEVEVALSEAWQWLRIHLLVVPAPGMNGQSGFLVLSRKGNALATGSQDEFTRFQAAAAFPRALLHPAIADKVWLALARGDLDVAVFTAFKTVEEAVRLAGGFAATDIGTDLVRKAFHLKTGPLTDQTHPEAEREALAHLFAGAIGSYKNPHSHRTVLIADSQEAQEMVLLASHLLRIVDARAKRASGQRKT